MHLEILTPGSKVFTGEVRLIKVPGSKGSFEIMNNHAPIISTLDNGNLKIVTDDDETIFYDIKGGVVQVVKNNIIVLAESLTKVS